MLETLALMGHGFVNAMSLSNLLFMAGGTAIGIIIGCLPGLSAAMGVALLLPMTFYHGPGNGTDRVWAPSTAARSSAAPSPPF